MRDKPKVMIFDCCRSKIGATDHVSVTFDKSQHNHKNKGANNPRNAWINEKYHVNSGLATIFSNFEDYSVSDSSYGGCFNNKINF